MSQKKDAKKIAASMERMAKGLEGFIEGKAIKNPHGGQLLPDQACLEGYFAVFLNDLKMVPILDWLQLNHLEGPAALLKEAYNAFWSSVNRFDKCDSGYTIEQGKYIRERERPEVIRRTERLKDVLRECAALLQEYQASASTETLATIGTPDTNPQLIYQSNAADFYSIPKSTLSASAKKQSGEPGYLWSGTKGKRRFYRKKDLERISRSRRRLRGS